MNKDRALIDTNIIVYATDETSIYHLRAKEFLERMLPTKKLVVALQNLTELYSLLTNKKQIPHYLTADEALTILAAIIKGGDYTVITPTNKTPTRLLSLLKQYPAKGAEIHDVHLAAVMTDHHVSTIYTADTSVFKKLKFNAINPFI
jgi:predicted nucleic acid-binding protein